ncbi:SDR family oxidoreductase [Shewanella intestini]|uniref:SDR family oxidoreductase n=1 Tax=Shewanella intestini TaxID=2017544 RepID=A0ABS5I4F9_9GAMM|nr:MULTISPECIES: SDR family oxidoreductase [Shewanella]MBR9728904.1 SDR family oxidoreductase [Shewanella intestini]MRG37030.1 SDR family oxidoreductase [Shewanella sp. XMDDZSB0408]
MNNLSPYRILITGGASGLGKAMALTWAKHYQQQDKPIAICIADIHPQRALETLDALDSLGANAFFCHCDISQDDDVTHLRQQVIKEFNGVDCIINNAGVATAGSLTSEDIAQWQWLFNINLYGMVRVCQTFVDDFRRQGNGYFINIASQAALTPTPLMASYNAVKAAVVSFSETLKLELCADNIAVSVVCPSFFKTNLNESLRSSEALMHNTVARLFEKADLHADEVAQHIYQQAQQQRFLILTHKLGKRAYFMKKFLPVEVYLKRAIAGTARLVAKSRQAQENNK